MSEVRAGVAAARVLAERGVRWAFTVPGESFLGMLDALRETPQIRLIPTRHEGGAAFMAEAVGKLTGVPALCMGTRGVGAANLAIGLHTARQDSTPLIALVGQVETPVRHREALQEVDLAPLLGEVTKWAVEAPNGARLPELAHEAHRRSVAGRPGPVAIALRGDILDEPVSAAVPPPSATPRSGVRPADVAAIVALLAEAARPLIIAGGGVTRAGATDLLVAVAEAFGVPVVSAFRRNDAFPNDHPRYLGSLSFGGPPIAAQRARAADVVLAIGTRLSEMTTLGYTLPTPGTALIHIDVAPEVLGQTFPARLALAADAGEALAALLAVAPGAVAPARAAANAADRRAYVRQTTPHATADGAAGAVDPARVIAELQDALPPNAILTVDAGNFWGWVARAYQFRRPRTLLGPTSGAMGYAIPAGVAAALVTAGTTPVAALAGDGGFLMTGSELAVAAQQGARLTCIVFDNARYSTIRLHQERAYPGREAATELWSPDFVRYAEAFGGLGIRVERDRDVRDALRAALDHPGIALVSVAADRDRIAVGTRLSDLGPGSPERSRTRR
ncbi:MAG: hypothetical protein IT337_17300 [Thermomicrobiales bacterium]|nr:hypothetical protein [Thermomicrobiales bacterium]